MNKFIEGLRTSLETALLDMNGFMGLVTTAVTTNAPTIKKQYEDLGLSLDSAIIDPWTEAAAKIKEFGGVDGLGVMNSWVTEGGAIYDFDTKATSQLKSPWNAGKTAVGEFESSVKTGMSNVVTSIKSNVSTSLTELNKLKTEMAKINDTTVKPKTDDGGGDPPPKTPPKGPPKDDVKALQEILNSVFGKKLTVDGEYGPATQKAVGEVQIALKQTVAPSLTTDGLYNNATKLAMAKWMDAKITEMKNGKYGGSSAIGQGVRYYTEQKDKLPTAFHAKGTLGTNKDELAITDESWIGEEITLAAGKNGQLQYLKKGSAVMPADISANLVEWGKINPNMMKVGGGANLNMISNAVNQPEFNMSFDSLVHVDHCDEGTLKDLEKMVDTKINQFSKQMNYAIKKIGGR